MTAGQRIVWGIVLAVASARPARSAGEPAPVRIDVALVEHKDGERRVISGSRIEGRAGTDFELEFTLDQFVLTGRFITDLVGTRALEVTAHLVARRLHGRSERDLPLWEEDIQDRTVEVGFDEALVLWPFGRERDALSIEIAPALGPAGPLHIEPFPLGRGGTLQVRAHRVPHRFACDAALIEAGRELAHVVADCRLGRPARLALGPAAADRAISVIVEGYERDRPTDAVTVRADLSGGRGGASRARAMGTASLGQALRFRLDDGGAELRLTVRLADGEPGDGS